jgi:hypothetical protein
MIASHLRSSPSSIKEAKFQHKLSKQNVHNYRNQRNSFISRITESIKENGLPDMYLKIKLLK